MSLSQPGPSLARCYGDSVGLDTDSKPGRPCAISCHMPGVLSEPRVSSSPTLSLVPGPSPTMAQAGSEGGGPKREQRLQSGHRAGVVLRIDTTLMNPHAHVRIDED